MNQYERIVSYIYQYNKEEKGANVGYAKVEKRGNKCRISVQMRAVPIKQVPAVYLYKQLPEGIQTVAAGQMGVRGNSMLWKDSCDADKLFASDWRIDDVDGIFIDGKDKIYFATSWRNDKFFRGNWDNSLTAGEGEEASEERGEVSSGLEENAAGEQIQDVSQMEPESEQEEPVDSRESQAQSGTSESQNALGVSAEGENSETVRHSDEAEEPQPGHSHKAVNFWNVVQAQGPGKVQNGVQDQSASNSQSSAVTESSDGHSVTTSVSEIQKKEKEPEDSSTGQELQMQSICGVCPFKRKSFDYGKKILMTFPSMRPFQNGVARACVRMELQDIGCLPIASWSLSGNRFLLHGYYCYRHLLFAQLADGRYVLGVPGIYSEKERRNAVKFGFSDFQSIGDFGMQQGVFGYWFLELPAGNLNHLS